MQEVQKKQTSLVDAFPFYKLLPNIITLTAICFGLTAIRYGLDSKWEQSLLCILISAFLDGMDGRLARYLNVTSDFGAILDSLADVINFGVAPSFIVYMWTLSDINIKGLGWGAALLFPICGAVRLARFNVTQATNANKLHKIFFTGIPIPVGGILAIAPIAASLEFSELTFVTNPWFNAVYLVSIALAMVSTLPTISIKYLHISKKNVKLFLTFVIALIVMLIIKPWFTVVAICTIYLIFLPITIIIFRKKANALKQSRN